MSQALLNVIKEKSKHLDALRTHVRHAKSRMMFNKSMRSVCAEHLRQMKADLKQADRDGEYAMASVIRLQINSYRIQLKDLLSNYKRTTKYIDSTYTKMGELQDEIRELDAVAENIKAQAAAEAVSPV